MAPPASRPGRGGTPGGGGGDGRSAAAAAGAMELVQAAWGRYQRKMRKAPLQTKAVTAAAIQGASDVLGQLLTKPRGARLRLGKTAKMAFFGLVWVGPSIHFWQNFMEGVAFRGAPPGTPTVLRKTVFDQLTYGPVQNVA